MEVITFSHICKNQKKPQLIQLAVFVRTKCIYCNATWYNAEGGMIITDPTDQVVIV